jgi:hypothetical protein
MGNGAHWKAAFPPADWESKNALMGPIPVFAIKEGLALYVEVAAECRSRGGSRS